MRVVGLIAEYNPFHNGHKYHIEKAKEVANSDFAVVVMSGNYVQRGTPAIIPKHIRAEMALKCGADLIIELPVCYATGTAEQFAYGAVSILDKLGCINTICFGSECGDIDVLKNIAKLLSDESPEYKNALQANLRSGMSFPAARQAAIDKIYPHCNYGQILSEPNNILGIEYLKAIYRVNSDIEPVTISRITSHYHDTELRNQFSSATAIRNLISDDDLSELYGQIPSACMPLLENIYKIRYPVHTNDFSLLLKYRLLNETALSLTSYADVSVELANRICKHLNTYTTFEQFCELLKTKEITYSRISRALLHILLNIKKEDYSDIEYAHALGFRSGNKGLLSELKLYSSIPFITKLSVENKLSDSAKKMLEHDIYASNLYESVISDKFNKPFVNELQHSIIRL